MDGKGEKKKESDLRLWPDNCKKLTNMQMSSSWLSTSGCKQTAFTYEICFRVTQTRRSQNCIESQR